MGTATVIATGARGSAHNIIEQFIPLKDALIRADEIAGSYMYRSVLVYTETNDGVNLTLIYRAC